MPGLKQLLSWFDSGALVRPSADAPNFTDLARSIASLAGAGGVELTDGAGRLREIIGAYDHYILILVDGLGSDLLAKAPEGGFLKRHRVMDLQAVFPPTTAAALTTLATGLWPAEHAVVGWWLYLPESRLSLTALPFVERFTETSLARLGVAPETVFPAPSAWSRMTHAPLTVIPDHLAGSVYTRYSSGGTPRLGYRHTAEAFEAAYSRVAAAQTPTLTYLYLPYVDSLCHEAGTCDAGVARLVADIDARVEALARGLEGRARIIVTADHGLADVPGGRAFAVTADDPLMDCLAAPPSCEPAVPVFHVRRGRRREFARLFYARTCDCFALISTSDAERLQLFGPGPFAAATRERLGTHLAVSSPPSAFYYQPPGEKIHPHVGLHAGLARAEMIVPLIIA